MNDKQMIKVDRRNMLDKFFDSYFGYKVEKAGKEIFNHGFAGQHTSEKRQAKLAAMKRMGIKSGKVFKRTMQALRLKNRLEKVRNEKNNFHIS